MTTEVINNNVKDATSDKSQQAHIAWVQDRNSTWWHNAVIYQVYPRSFKDSTGNGVGDLRGVAEKIPYLAWLGIDAIWLNPFYPSGGADGGYDVIDYRNVDPLLGTMEDFDILTEVAHQHGIKIICDIVPNHTSNQHPWFEEALVAGADSQARDRYIFREGKGEHGELPPTSWTAHFGGSAWTRVDDGQWYLHLFTKEQPDLNWNNQEVRNDFLHTLRFWADHGVDGFRIDVAHGLAKDLERDDLEDYDAQEIGPAPTGGPLYDLPELDEIYGSWRALFNEYNPPLFAVAEANVQPDRQYRYADLLGQVFNFEFAKVEWIRDVVHTAIEDGLATSQRSHSPATWVLSNHDIPRHAARFGLPQIHVEGHPHQLTFDWLLRNGTTYSENREHGAQRAAAAILLELALPGSVYVYQGEELGLSEVADIPWKDLQDPNAFTTTGSGTVKGRDGCRVPLPWTISKDANYGFSTAIADSDAVDTDIHTTIQASWLPQPQWFSEYSVEAESNNPHSMLTLYRSALTLRRSFLAQIIPAEQGDNTGIANFQWLPEDTASDLADGADGNRGGVIAFERIISEQTRWKCITNFGVQPIPLPQGNVVLTSCALQDNNTIPQDCTVWIIDQQV